MKRRGEAVILVLFGVPTALLDWEIATTWSLPAWISLLAALVAIGSLALVLFVPRFRAAGSALAVSVLYGLPVAGGILRWHLVATPTALIGDGAYQIQIARDVLLRGIDPYGFNYVGTGMERTPWSQPFPNPSLHHLVYWPGTVLLPLPVQGAFQALVGWWDERLWLLVAAVAVWILLGRLAPDAVGRMAAIAFFLIPGHSLLAVLGDNDLPMVALLLGAILTIHGRRWLIAGLLIGLAVATKQTALIVIPVLVAWSLAHGIDRHDLRRAVVLGMGAAAVLFAPFLIWNARAFVTDTITFTFGAGSEAYPIQGIGLSAWLLDRGIIHGARDAFPFLAIQLPLVISAWVLAWRWFRSHRLAGDAIFWIGAAFFVFLFTNRFSQQAYLLLGVELILAGLILRLAPAAGAASQQDMSAAA